MHPKQVNRDVKRLDPKKRGMIRGSVAGSAHPRTVGRDVQFDKNMNKGLYNKSDREDQGLI